MKGAIQVQAGALEKKTSGMGVVLQLCTRVPKWLLGCWPGWPWWAPSPSQGIKRYWPWLNASPASNILPCFQIQIQLPCLLLRKGAAIPRFSQGTAVFENQCIKFWFYREECKASVDKYQGARYKKFSSEAEAWQFVNDTDSAQQRPSASNYQGSSRRGSRGGNSRYGL